MQASRNVVDDVMLGVAAEGGVICTATQRLARYLRQEWDTEMLRRGEEVWETPRILPYASWREELLRTAALHSSAGSTATVRVMSAAQERITWERAVRAELAGQELQPELLARQLMEAHQLQQAWEIGDDALRRHSTSGSELYLRVISAIRKLWDTLQLRPASAVPQYARKTVQAYPELLPPSILLAGFDLLPDRAFSSLITDLQNRGVRVTKWESQPAQAEPAFFEYSSFEEEIDAAALWCRELLQRGKRDIAVVLPSLEHARDLVERRFSDILDPGHVLYGHDAETGLFEMSLGKHCAEEPMLAAALQVIELLLHEMSLETLSALLRGPFTMATDLQRRQRIEVDLRLRASGRSDFTQAVLQRIIGDYAEDDVLLRVLAQRDGNMGVADAAGWARRFEEILKRIGWPGDRSLTSREFQARRRMEQLIEEYATYTSILPVMQPVEAVSRFRALVKEQIFQPESSGAPVQIMGVLETAGMRVTHCRIIGMNAERWPPPMRTNAFIPIAAQRKAGVTDVLPEQYLRQMRELTKRTEGMAEELVYSCSSREADKDLLSSPLLRHIPRSVAVHEGQTFAAALQNCYPENTEDVPPATATRLQSQEKIRGGTRILRLQSACPFRAFAELRLHAAAPAEAQRGVQLRDRGSLMHRILELFWKEIRSQKTLLRLNEDQVRERLHALLSRALQEQNSTYSGGLPQHVEAAEVNCILKILTDWLRGERERDEFRVLHVEREADISIGSLEFGVVIDRVDEVGTDRRLLLIDYKSGLQGPRDWTGERLGDPQLPLYAVTRQERISGLAFGILRRGDSGFAGLCDDAACTDGLKPAAEWMQKQGMQVGSWEDIISFWRNSLTSLSEEFVNGVAHVHPSDGDMTCRYCHLRHLCRIDELSAEVDDE